MEFNIQNLRNTLKIIIKMQSAISTNFKIDLSSNGIQISTRNRSKKSIFSSCEVIDYIQKSVIK